MNGLTLYLVYQPGQSTVLKIPNKYSVLSKIIKLDLSDQLGEQLRPVNQLQMVQVVVFQQVKQVKNR